MAGNTPALTAFALDVHSNSRDFAVVDVTHGGRDMHGVLALRDIDGDENPLFVGSYPGRIISTAEAAMKRRAYGLRHGLTSVRALQTATAYNLCADEIEFGCELDPTDLDGRLLPEFAGHFACFVNEPPPGCKRNATFAYNAPRNRYEIWLTRPIATGDEVFLCYGRKFHREYEIDAKACEGSRLRRIFDLVT